MEAAVEELIWGVPRLLNDDFSPEEVELIRSTLLSVQDVEDRRIWHYESNGKFSVRSVYQMAQGILENNGSGASGSSSSFGGVGEKIWKKLWNASVPER